MNYYGCNYHETFSDDIDGGSFNDGCVCHNEKLSLKLDILDVVVNRWKRNISIQRRR